MEINKFDDLKATIQKADALAYEVIESKLEEEIATNTEEILSLATQRAKLGTPDALYEILQAVIWEQIVNQIAVTAGEDFIKANKDLLNLSDDVHLQTTENFTKGKIAYHNTIIDYQKRNADWQSHFRKDQQGNTTDTLVEGYRVPYDADRPMGSASMHKDHTIPVKEIILDPEAATHLTEQEKIAFANSSTNLKDLDASANQSKGDRSMEEWLNSERNGQTPADRFNIDEDQCRANDKAAREEFAALKEKGKATSIAAGRQSQLNEAFRVGEAGVRAVIMHLLASLLKKIIASLVKWFKSANRKFDTLKNSIWDALIVFKNNLKNELIAASNSFFTTLLTTIFGPIISVIKKAFIFLKQGWSSLKEAYDYINNPANKDKPTEIMVAEIGKIIISGLAAGGAILLGENISAALSVTFPLLALEIPMLGSLASLIGIFMGAVVSGIIGAFALHQIDQYISDRLKAANLEQTIDVSNNNIVLQTTAVIVAETSMEDQKQSAIENIMSRHQATVSLATTVQENLRDLIENSPDNTAVKNNITRMLLDM